MNYLHYELDLRSNDTVEVTLDRQANVRLMDSANYSKYRKGKSHKYFGGHTKVSPAHINAPRSGHWHVVIDLGGYAGTVKASVRTIKA